MFGKLYRRSFLDHYNIRMNMSHSNEDTGYNCVVKGCSNKIWYIPKPVYTWRFKPNSITRFNNGMYGSESGMCGYLTNMIWQIKELEKRFVNKNYILEQIISIMCVLYHFYIENVQRYPLGAEANLEWIRYYYEQCYKPYEHLIEDATLNQIFAKVAAEQNIAGKGIIPKITFFDFMKEIKSKPYNHDKMHDVGGSVIEIPQTTPENYPVEVKSFFNPIPIPNENTNTNLGRMDGMKKVLEDDKKQREDFLNKEIIPNIVEDVDNSNEEVPTLNNPNSSSNETNSNRNISSAIALKEAIRLNQYYPRWHKNENDMPLPCVIDDDGHVYNVPENVFKEYWSITNEIPEFDFCKGDVGMMTRDEFLAKFTKQIYSATSSNDGELTGNKYTIITSNESGI